MNVVSVQLVWTVKMPIEPAELTRMWTRRGRDRSSRVRECRALAAARHGLQTLDLFFRESAWVPTCACACMSRCAGLDRERHRATCAANVVARLERKTENSKARMSPQESSRPRSRRGIRHSRGTWTRRATRKPALVLQLLAYASLSVLLRVCCCRNRC